MENKKVIKMSNDDLKNRSYLTGKYELWVDVGGGDDESYRKNGHFGASLTFRFDKESQEWILKAISISDPKHHNCCEGDSEFNNYILDTPFGTTNHFKYGGIINYAFDGDAPYILKEYMENISQ